MVFLTQCDSASMYMQNVIRQRLLPGLRVTDIELVDAKKATGPRSLSFVTFTLTGTDQSRHLGLPHKLRSVLLVGCMST